MTFSIKLGLEMNKINYMDRISYDCDYRNFFNLSLYGEIKVVNNT